MNLSDTTATFNVPIIATVFLLLLYFSFWTKIQRNFLYVYSGDTSIIWLFRLDNNNRFSSIHYNLNYFFSILNHRYHENIANKIENKKNTNWRPFQPSLSIAISWNCYFSIMISLLFSVWQIVKSHMFFFFFYFSNSSACCDLIFPSVFGMVEPILVNLRTRKRKNVEKKKCMHW